MHMQTCTGKSTPIRCAKGFTLVEIVIAALLGALLLAIFLTFAFRFTQVYNELQGAELKMSAEANSILDRIEEDLGSVIFQKDEFEWLSYWDNPTQDAALNVKKANITADQGDRPDDFQLEKSGILLCISRSPQLDKEQKRAGDVVSVAYRLAYIDPAIPEDSDSPGNTFCLYRIPNPPDVTFENFLARESLAEVWEGQPFDGKTVVTKAPPYGINSLLPEFLLLRNVVEFSIQMHGAYLPEVDLGQKRNRYARNYKYFRIPPPGTDRTDVRIGGKFATNVNPSDGIKFPDDLAKNTKVYPTTAIVRITLISDEGMKIFRAAQEDKRPDIENMEHLIEEYGFSFQRTILLPSPI